MISSSLVYSHATLVEHECCSVSSKFAPMMQVFMYLIAVSANLLQFLVRKHPLLKHEEGQFTNLFLMRHTSSLGKAGFSLLQTFLRSRKMFVKVLSNVYHRYMNTSNRIGKWSVIFGIVIVLNLFFNYALSLVYKSPDYNTYCPTTQVVTVPDNQNACVEQGGQWTNNAYYGNPVPAGVKEPTGYCDLQYTCRAEYETANKSYQRNVFVVLVVLGALSVLAGNMFVGNPVIASGLSLAGVLSFLIASMRYWSSANDIIRVIILAIALGLLFWIAMKKFNDRVQS